MNEKIDTKYFFSFNTSRLMSQENENNFKNDYLYNTSNKKFQITQRNKSLPISSNLNNISKKLKNIASLKRIKDYKLIDKKQKNDKFIETNFKKLYPESNIYTSEQKYIQNKECLLFDKYQFENDKYMPDRTDKYNMKGFPKVYNDNSHRNKKIYKTIIFRNNKNVNDLYQYVKNNNTKLNKINDKEKINNKSTYEKSIFDSTYSTKIADTLYKDINIQKNLFIGRITKTDKKIGTDNSNQILKTNSYIYKTLLAKNKLDKNIPLTYPKCMTSTITCESKSSINRYIKIYNELIKLKYLISIDKKNSEKLYLKEFLIKNGIEDKDINEISLNNFSKFICQDEIKINQNLTMKENLCKIIKLDMNMFSTVPDIIFHKKESDLKINEQINEEKSENKYEEISSLNELSNQTKLYNSIVNNYAVNDLYNELDNSLNNEKMEKELINKRINYKYQMINKDKKYVKNNSCNNIKEPKNMQLKINNFKSINSTESPSDFFIQNSNNLIEDTQYKSNYTIKNKYKNKSINIDELNENLYYSRVELPNSLEYEKFKEKKKLTEYIFLEKQRKQDIINNYLDYSNEKPIIQMLNNSNKHINKNN